MTQVVFFKGLGRVAASLQPPRHQKSSGASRASAKQSSDAVVWTSEAIEIGGATDLSVSSQIEEDGFWSDTSDRESNREPDVVEVA